MLRSMLMGFWLGCRLSGGRCCDCIITLYSSNFVLITASIWSILNVGQLRCGVMHMRCIATGKTSGIPVPSRLVYTIFVDNHRHNPLLIQAMPYPCILATKTPKLHR